MKTWTNPTVEELEVKMTAANIFGDHVEYEQNGQIDWDLIDGNPFFRGTES